MSGGGLLTPVGEPYLRSEGLHLSQVARSPLRARPQLQPLVDLDGALYFVMLLSLLFLDRLETYGAAIFSLAMAFYIFRRRDAFRAVLHDQWFFLLFPLLAILSTAWSDAASDTLKHSVEFAATVIAGLLLPSARNQRSMVYAMFTAFGLYTVVSLAFGDIVRVGVSGATAISGLAGSKNEQASSVATGAMVALLWFFLGLQTKRYFQCLVALGVGLVELYATYLALSAGAIASLTVGAGVFIILAAISKANRHVKVAVVGFGGVAALTIAITFLTFTGQIVEWLSSAFGKDMTLTGRTYLWTRARDLVAEHPFLGQGFDAFWQQGNLDAEGLWQYAHIRSRAGFNFHNTSYDILVSLGWIGMILFALVLIAGLCKVAGAYVRKPSLLGCFWLGMAAFMVVRMPVETMGIYEFNFSTILLFAIFGFGLQSASKQSRRDALRLVPYETGFFAEPRGGYVL